MNKGIEAQEILQIRQDFPLFRNDPVIYLDNSATTQKPDAVLNAVSEFYGHDNANPVRGIYNRSERATERYEAARVKCATLGWHTIQEMLKDKEA